MAQDPADSDEVNAGLDHPAGRRVPEVVNPEAFDRRLAESGPERRVDVPEVLPGLGVLEDELASPIHPAQHLEDQGVHRDLALPAALRFGVGDADEALDEIDVRPAEPQDLALPHARAQRQDEEGPEAGRRDLDEPPGLARGKNPLFPALLAELLDPPGRVGFRPVPFDGFDKNRLETRELPVDRRRRDTAGAAGEPILLDELGRHVREILPAEESVEVGDADLVPGPGALVLLRVELEVFLRVCLEEDFLPGPEAEPVLFAQDVGLHRREHGRGLGLRFADDPGDPLAPDGEINNPLPAAVFLDAHFRLATRA